MVLPNADTHAGQRGGSRPSPRLSEFPVVETAITADWGGQQGPKAERKTQGHTQKIPSGFTNSLAELGRGAWLAGGGVCGDGGTPHCFPRSSPQPEDEDAPSSHGARIRL